MRFFFQAEDGIRDFCLSRGLGELYKRQVLLAWLKQHPRVPYHHSMTSIVAVIVHVLMNNDWTADNNDDDQSTEYGGNAAGVKDCLLSTSAAADGVRCVRLGVRVCTVKQTIQPEQSSEQHKQ